MPHSLRLRLRLKAGKKLVLGPGRLDILEGIQATGSISAAARGMGMSYRRAWTLVDDINQCFRDPLVESIAGGQRGGGARLTPLGETVAATYRRLLDTVAVAAEADKTALEALLAETLPAPRANE
jgi:molybdate transport system regulatory protein